MKRSTQGENVAPHSARDPGSAAGLGLMLTLFSFAVAQPLYDLVGRFPAFFIARSLGPSDVPLFVVLVSLLLPAAWWVALELLARAVPRARRVAYKISLGLLSAALIAPWVGSIEGLGPGVVAVLSCVLGAVVSHLILERAGARTFTLLLTPSVVVFAVIVLLRPGIKELWWPESTSHAAEERREELAEDSPPIVLLVLDGLPTASLMNDRLEIDGGRYPAFARLAREGTWYRLATTVATETAQAVPAILTGRCPVADKPPTFESHPQNLFTFLGDTYDLDVVETVTQLCPPELCARDTPAFAQRFAPLLQDASIVLGHRLLPLAWAARLPPVDKNWGGFAANANRRGRPKRTPRDVEIERYREMVARIQATTDPTLRFAHVVLPHEPFLYLSSGRNYRAGSEPGGSWKTLAADPWVAWHGYQRHLLQLGFAERLLSELLAALDAADLYDESLLIVTADHGSAFVPGQPRRALGQTNLVDILAVPLLVKLPFQRLGSAHDGLVQTVDVAAMVADALGLRPPSWMEGRKPPAAPGQQSDVSCRQLEQQQVFRLSLNDLAAAAERKTRRFGTGADGVFPRVGPRLETVGAGTEEVSCPTLAGVHVTVENEPQFRDVDPAGGFVPAEVVGTIYGPRVRDLDLAVAVNGTVRATTRPYQLGSAGATFSAIVPEDSFRPGRNEVEVFAVGDGESCRLQPLATAADGNISLLDTQLGAWADPRVEEKGFAKTELSGATVMRWTRGTGRLVVPLSPDQAAELRAVRLDLRGIAREGSDLRVMLGKDVLFDGRVEKVPWSGTFPVGEWPRRGPARIVIKSSTFSDGPARFGVGVEGVWLLSHEP